MSGGKKTGSVFFMAPYGKAKTICPIELLHIQKYSHKVKVTLYVLQIIHIMRGTMGFRENLRQKIRIDALAAAVKRSMKSQENTPRIDLESMRKLIELGGFRSRRERDLDLFLLDQIKGAPRILVLDNELKLYATTVEDIALRKSPTIKEMVSIRNAIKILNDKDVVVTRKADTVETIRQILISSLDLSFEAADVEALARDGRDALQNNYADGVIDILELFAELLGFRKAPKAFQAAHHVIFGRLHRKDSGEIEWGPWVAFNLMQNSLQWVHGTAGSRNKAAMAKYHQVFKAEAEADIAGPEVFSALLDAVMAEGV